MTQNSLQFNKSAFCQTSSLFPPCHNFSAINNFRGQNSLILNLSKLLRVKLFISWAHGTVSGHRAAGIDLFHQAAGLCLCLLLHTSLHYQLHPPYIVGLGPEVNGSIFLWGTVVGVLPIGYLVGGKRVN